MADLQFAYVLPSNPFQSTNPYGSYTLTYFSRSPFLSEQTENFLGSELHVREISTRLAVRKFIRYVWPDPVRSKYFWEEGFVEYSFL